MFKDHLISKMKDRYSDEITFANGVSYIYRYLRQLQKDFEEAGLVKVHDLHFSFNDDGSMKLEIGERWIEFEQKDLFIWVSIPEYKGYDTLSPVKGNFVSQSKFKLKILDDEMMDSYLQAAFEKLLQN